MTSKKLKATRKRYYMAHKEQSRETTRRWAAANPEKVKAKQDRRYEIDKKAGNRRRTFVRYGLTEAQFDAMLAYQGGACAICGTREPTGNPKQWHVDHDHAFDVKDERGHRGILCHHCNTALGLFGDDAGRLKAAIKYLRNTAGRA